MFRSLYLPRTTSQNSAGYFLIAKNVDETMRLRRPRTDRAKTDRTMASKARDVALRASVRMLIWTDMAPSFAKVVATAAAARKGMNMEDPFGVGGWGMKKRPEIALRALWWVMTGIRCTGKILAKFNFEVTYSKVHI